MGGKIFFSVTAKPCRQFRETVAEWLAYGRGEHKVLLSSDGGGADFSFYR